MIPKYMPAFVTYLIAATKYPTKITQEKKGLRLIVPVHTTLYVRTGVAAGVEGRQVNLHS